MTIFYASPNKLVACSNGLSLFADRKCEKILIQHISQLESLRFLLSNCLRNVHAEGDKVVCFDFEGKQGGDR
jgi:hypothetical protein